MGRIQSYSQVPMRRFLSLATMLVGSLTISAAALAQSAGWKIGPIIRGKNYSVGMPLEPTPARQGWSFDFPPRGGHVHYVTYNPGSLKGASRITVRYRIDAAPDTRFVPQQAPAEPATLSLYFQRAGDNWSGRRQFEHFRWYAPLATMRQLSPGEHQFTVRLNDPSWISVMGQQAGALPSAFAASLDESASAGLVFGSNSGRGHGVYATAPAKFTLLSFRID